MLSFRPGEKLYVRCLSGFRCSFFESLEDLRFLSLRLLLRSGPEAVISAPLCLPGPRCVPASCIASSSDRGISAPPRVGLRLLFLRNGHMPMVPSASLSAINGAAAGRHCGSQRQALELNPSRRYPVANVNASRIAIKS
jgi:hypothetical protein